MRKGEWKNGKPRIVNQCCQECRIKDARIQHLKTISKAFVTVIAELDPLATKSDVKMLTDKIEGI